MGATSPSGNSTSGGTVKAARTFHDGTTNRVLIGFRPKGAGGIRVSKPGVDVLTGTPDQMVMDSLFNMFKIVAVGTGTVTKSASSTIATTTIPHGLGYAPVIVAFLDESFGAGTGPYMPVQRLDVDTTTGIVNTSYEAWCDKTNVYLRIQTAVNGNTYAFGLNAIMKFYLMQETAS